jgi:adenosylcobinamide-GDP ribazoletransferase
VVGLFFGLVAGCLFFILNLLLGSLISAIIALLAVHMLNRFLHIDGLSDLGDGLLAGGSKEKKIAAMKDSRSGVGGVAYLFFFELLAVAAIAQLSGQPQAIWLFAPLAAEVLAKNALLTAAASGESAPGLAGIFVKNTEEKAAAFSLALSLLIIIPIALLLTPFTHWCLFWTLTVCLAMALVSTLVGYIVAKVAMRNFGMVNGDVLGATNEISRPVVLITLLVVVKCLESVPW